MQEKLNQLSLAEKLFSGGSIILFLDALIFDWFSFSGFGYGGFDYPGGTWVTLAIIIALGLTGLMLAIRFGNVAAPNLPAGWTWGMVYGAGTGLIALFVLLKAWRILAAPVGGFGIGFFIGVIATAAIGYGGYLLYSEDKGGGFASLTKR